MCAGLSIKFNRLHRFRLTRTSKDYRSYDADKNYWGKLSLSNSSEVSLFKGAL